MHLQLTKILPRLLIVLALCLPVSGQAQSLLADNTAAPDLAAQIDRLEQALAQTENVLRDVDAEAADLRAQRAAGVFEAQQAYNASLADFAQYEIELRDHALSLLEWQLVSAYVILALVVGVTMLGIVLSFVEVRSSLTAPREAIEALGKAGFATGEETGEDGTPAPANGTTLIVSAQKLQVTSAITGVVILVLSLGFLYLFVKEVLEAVPTDFTSGFVATAATAEASGGDTGS